MRLIKVYSNIDSFRTVEFNKNGPSFILAKQVNKDNSKQGATYNGVGKSLLIRIIHFCLGASSRSYNDFSSKLTDWTFYLDFEINGNSYTSKRSSLEPNKIYLNDEELNLNKFNNFMKKQLFNIPTDVKYLSFRSLIPFFIRPDRKSYADYDKPVLPASPYQVLITNSFFMGISPNIVQSKQTLKKEKNRIKTLNSNFKHDSLLKEYFTGNKDVKLEIIDIEDEIKHLETNVSEYKVAEDYAEIQNKADILDSNVYKLQNEIILIQNNIDNINKSLKLSPDLAKDYILDVYEEANFNFPNQVINTLEEVELFYNKLINNRNIRLVNQRENLELKKKEKSKNLKIQQTNLDKHLKYLGDHQALDIFINLNTRITDLKTEKEKLLKYQNLQSEYKDLMRDTNKEMIDLISDAELYLEEISDDLNDLLHYFRNLAKIFYPSSPSGLHVETNDGDNQVLYNIEAKIESDKSDGINNVKIFCYDLTILIKGHNHNINFIFHDSRLYDGIDQRQKVELFKIIYNQFNNSNKQYISTINQNQLDEIKELLDEDEFYKIIEKNTVLILTDEDDSEKLLGIRVDLNV